LNNQKAKALARYISLFYRDFRSLAYTSSVRQILNSCDILYIEQKPLVPQVPYTPNLMLFDLTSNITKYLTSSDMNYLALLSVCATYAPDFFCVYNLSDWFQEERSLKLKSRMRLKREPLPPHLDEYSSQKSPPSRYGKTFPGFLGSYPPVFSHSLPFLSFILPPFFSDLQKIAFFGPTPTGYVSLQI